MTRTTDPLPMEAQERVPKENASTSKDPVVFTMNPEVLVDPGTLSTADASLGLGAGAVQDASVVSAITDHASLEGQLQPNSFVESAALPPQRTDPEVPRQVIFPEDGRPVSVPPPVTEPGRILGTSASSPPQIPDPLAINNLVAPVAQSLPALPDERSAPEQAVLHSAHHPRTHSLDDIRSPTPVLSMDMKQSTDSDFNDMASPMQDRIAERSPGGRYVRFTEKLGSGASKDVYRAYDTQEGIEVAWNVVTLSGVPRTERNRIINEVRLLERLHHQNIISFHGSWVNRERQEINFVTEILSSGTLKSFIKKVQVIRWKIAKRWAVQILNGLAYLHAQEPPVIHRDLKCENIFINGTSGDLRIGDLGLSTVHRNGKVLSVLGTPEFMAPDMYEETPYNEKVDIYAFGMCMLEIFTKEIPYSECKNPAQIYKKVSAGEAPEVLNRLESRHAREFVILCLGYRDENGKYVRPSADELLKHPFLDKRANDDDEVIVERPLRERIIPESGESSSTSPNGANQREMYSNGTNLSQGGSILRSDQLGQSGDMRESASTTSGALAQHSRLQSTNSLDDDGNDHFEEMPESETNMRRVKVLIGRGQELKEDDLESTLVQESVPSAVAPVYHPPIQAQQSIQQPANPQNVPVPHVSASPVDAQAPAHNYLVAAAVIEDEAPHVRPYADDILKLVVTLPVEGQTQNVQFDFHLVRDDPVKVAKEMVQELQIPHGAVLEISETISALACSARMKQDSHNLKMQETLSQPPAAMRGAAPAPADPALPTPPEVHQASLQHLANSAVSHGQGFAPLQSSQSSRGQVGTPSHAVGPQHFQQHHPAVNQALAPGMPVSRLTPSGTSPQAEHSLRPFASSTSHGHSSHPLSSGVSPSSPRGSISAIGSAAASDMTVPFALQHIEMSMPAGHSELQQEQLLSSADHLGLNDDDEVLQAELRRLEEEYAQNLARAKKVFDSRMVNLQRSQKEKEKEHQKTLEKHQKERAEFEKRRALEEEQQQRRIEQMQRERDRKIQALAEEKRRALRQNATVETNAEPRSGIVDTVNRENEKDWTASATTGAQVNQDNGQQSDQNQPQYPMQNGMSMR